MQETNNIQKQEVNNSQQSNKKNKKTMVLLIGALLIVSLFFIFKDKIIKPKPTKIYEVAVMMRSQHNSDPTEDKRTSLKKGDVLVVQKEGHNWSKTERVSYLILKMRLTEEQAQKLTQAKTKKLKEKDLSEQEREMIKKEKEEAKKREEKYTPNPDLMIKTVIAREYYIDFNKDESLKNIKANDLIKGQPLKDKVFDWKIVKRKK